MYSEATLRRIVEAIHSRPELNGCVIGFHGNNQSRVLHQGINSSANFGRVVVIVEESWISEAQVRIPDIAPVPAVVPRTPDYISNRSRVSAEFTGAAINCGLTVLSGAGVLFGGALEVVTGGASTVLVVMGWVGTATSGVQCLNGITRTVEAHRNPDSNSLQQWDTNQVYRYSMNIVDGLGVASSLISLPLATRNLIGILGRRGGLVTLDQLERMTRSQRQAAIQQAVTQATQTPAGREAVALALREAGLAERQVAQVMAHGAGTGRRARLVAGVLSEETARRLNGTIREIVGGVVGVGASATSERRTGSASGVVNALIVHVLGPGSN